MLADIHLGRFRLLEPLGKGGMGEVWLGMLEEGSRPLQVAVKVLTSEASRDASWRASFSNEVRAVASLAHPNIVAVFEHGEVSADAARASQGRLEAGAPYLVMEHVHGGTLTRMCGHMAWYRVKEVALGLLDGLAHAHARGVLHRDLKPGNVLLVSDPAEDGEEGPLQVKLTDFGLAHDLGGDLPDTSGAVAVDGGTPAYMAPEQFQGRWREYGPWTDLYALGCLVHYLVCGVPPWGLDRSFRTRRRDHLFRELLPVQPVTRVPEGFDTWLATLLQREPMARYQRAADAAWGLQALGTVIEDDDLLLPDPTEDVDLAVAARLATVAHQHHALPTLTSQSRDAVGARPDAGRPSMAPLPPTWRRPEVQARRRILGAGLGLFGLRNIPLVGRDSIRDSLWEALGEVREGQGARVVVLTGPAGCGKSRLAEWFCERAHEVGSATVLRATHSSTPDPGQGLAPMLVRHLRLAGLSREEILLRVEEGLRAQGLEEPDSAWALTEWLQPTLAPGRQAAGHRVLLGFLERLSAKRPLILALEDLQWGLDALRFAADLLDSHRPSRLLVVATVTEEALVEHPVEAAVFEQLLAREGAERLDVGPLPPEDRPALVREILGLEPDLARRVEARTEGNPLFAVQLVAQWVERDQLVEGEGGYRLADGVDLELPVGLLQVWGERVERLLSWRGEGDGRALELAAALGQDVDRAEWLQACALAGIRPAPDLVDALAGQRLVRTWQRGTSSGWSFVHPMVREAVERQAQEGGRLAEHHAACARLVRSLPEGSERALRLGRHLLAAGRVEEALVPLLEGTDLCITTGVYSQAESLLADREQALGLLGVPASDPRWGEGWLRRFRIARWRSRFAEAAGHLDQLESSASEHGWTSLEGPALAGRARLAHMEDDLVGSLALFGRAEAVALRQQQRALLAEIRWERGEVLTALARLEESQRSLEQALQDYAALGDQAGVARCWMSMGEVARNQGRHEDAAGLLEWSRDLFRVARYPWGEGSAINSLGDVRRYQGRLEEAQALYREARGVFRRLGSGSAVYPEYNLGLALLEAGRSAEAREVFTRTLAEFEAQGSRGSVAMAHLGLAACAADFLQWPEYGRHLGLSRALLQETGGAEEDLARLAVLVARVAGRRGTRERAEEALELARAQYRALGRPEEAEGL